MLSLGDPRLSFSCWTVSAASLVSNIGIAEGAIVTIVHSRVSLAVSISLVKDLLISFIRAKTTLALTTCRNQEDAIDGRHPETSIRAADVVRCSRNAVLGLAENDSPDWTIKLGTE